MYYKKAVNEVFEEFNTSEQGLSEQEAKNRLEKYGLNKISEKKEVSAWRVFISQFKSSLIYILLIAALLTLIIGRFTDMGVILAIVVIHAIIGFFQEYKAEKAMKSILKFTAPKAMVTRDADDKKIDPEKLVPGDIVILTAGNKIPADVRLFWENELEVNESAFTGESSPSGKTTAVIEKENLSVADQDNLAFMGTTVTRGRGKGIVIKTGEKTELGKISEQIKSTEKQETPLQKRLADFSKTVGLVSLALSLFVFIFGIIIGKDILEMVLFAISMAVAVIPEGLPVVVTITMAIGLNRMAKRNALIRKLIAVETLGSCNYICADKTGTITENRMTTTWAYANNKDFEIQGKGYAPKGDILLNGEKIDRDNDLEKMLLCGILCNDTDLYHEDNQWQISGDPTEGALVVAARKYGFDVEQTETEYARIDEIPFSSKRQYMATLNKKGDKCFLFVKGSPEKILQFSGEENNKELSDKSLQMTDSGLRVLGFAMKELDTCPEEIDSEYNITHGLNFLGFQGIIDPPRESAISAIQSTKEAGINTVIITGDHKETATAIAKQIGLFSEGDISITGGELDAKGDGFLKENVEKIRVYARVSPTHKLKIVEALQGKGHVTAVTGDGVNDAPALKKAAIGIAMGKTGTDVAKEAADMVLRDDNYESIFKAVEEGRIIFENIRKVVFFLLCTSLAEAGVIILSLFGGLGLPFLATQILWVNLVTNTIQDIALAYEPGEGEIGKRPPRNPQERIANPFFLKRMTLVAAVMTIGTLFYFWYALDQGETMAYARTATVNTIVFYQFFNVLNSRSFEKSIFEMNPFSNMFLLISLVLSVFAQIAFVTFKPMQFVFETTDLSAETWLHTVLIGISIIIVIEIDKFIRKKTNSGSQQHKKA